MALVDKLPLESLECSCSLAFDAICTLALKEWRAGAGERRREERVANGLKFDLELQLKVSCFRSKEIGVKRRRFITPKFV